MSGTHDGAAFDYTDAALSMRERVQELWFQRESARYEYERADDAALDAIDQALTVYEGVSLVSLAAELEVSRSTLNSQLVKYRKRRDERGQE